MGLLPSFFTVQVAMAPMPVMFFQALREIEVETSVGRASMFRLHFDLSRNIFGDFDALAFDIFRPLIPITIRISAGFGIPQALINGYVKDAQLSAANQPGASRLEVVGMDALGTIMAHIQQPFTWPNLPDSVAATAIFGKYAMVPNVFPTPPLRTILDTTSNQRDYDATYLFQLAARNNYELYVQPDPVIGLDIGHFHPPLTFMPPQGVLSIDFGTQTNLNNFSASNDMLRPTSVVGVTTDPHTRAPIPSVAPVSTELPMGLEPALNRIIPPPITRPAATDAASPAEAQAQAFARASSSSRAITANGEVDGLKYSRALLAGLPVLVRGAGRQNSGLYYVQSVTHRISRDNYTQTFSAWRNAVGLTGAEVFFDPLAAVA
ncbi:phage late control D family protein [Mesorhizobium sp. LjNodule214]|uniref:phage late control D family protein n=1 Tax=Mesorhizobium sp. LjNodule214 TaxID=3342252 RepID=UPI003ECF18CB